MVKMLKGYCVICVDNFDCKSSIAAAPCGHVFHNGCLFRWLSQRVKEGASCPKCRLKIKRRDCVEKLYFDVSTDQSFEIDEQNNSETLKNKISDLQASLRAKEVEINKLVQVEKSTKDELKVANLSVFMANESNLYLKAKLDFELIKTQTMQKEIRANAELKKEYEKLQNEITLYKNIQSAVSSSCEDIDFMLKSISNKDGAQNLATICTMMKRELINMKNQNREMKTKSNELAKINASLLIDKKLLQTECNSYQEELEYNKRESLSLKQDFKQICRESSPANGAFRNTDDSILVEPTPSPVRKLKYFPAACTATDLKHCNENLPMQFSKYELFKKRKKILSKENIFSSNLLTEEDKNEPLTPGVTHVFNGFGGHKRHMDSPTKSMCRKFDKIKRAKKCIKKRDQLPLSPIALSDD